MKSLFTLCIGLVLFSSLHAQIPSYVPTDGLVGWWPFNGNANDESGNGNDGLVNGAALTEDRFGISNHAYGGRVEVPFANTIELTSSFTLSAWYFANMIGAGTIISKWNDVSQSFKFFLVENNGFELAASFSGSTIVETVQTNSYAINSDGAWYHTVLNYDYPNSVKIYVNGILVKSATLSFSDLNNPEIPIFFGDNTFGNLFDDIAIYNRALTPEEISQLYAAAEEPVVECTPLAPNLQNGLVSYWPFCGNAIDESGNGNDGVVNGATLTEDRFGNANAAYSFDGVDDFIEVANDSSITLTGDLTMSAWVYGLGSTGNNYQTIISKRETYWTWEYLLTLSFHEGIIHNTKALAARALGMGNQEQAWSSTPYNLNTWELWTVTFTSNEVKIYKNGELDYSAPYSLVPNAQNSPLRFGYSLLDNDQFNGKIDDIAIWNRALSQEEITALYTGEPVSPPAACTPLPTNLQEGLVGYWPFCGNANDESGNGNDGVVNGATLTEDRFGNANAAYGFDGVSEFIEVNHSNSLIFSDQLSVSFWSKAPDYSMGLTPGPERCPIGKQRQAESGLVFETVDAIGTCCGPQFYLNDGVNTLEYEDSEPLSINQWNHITGVYNGSEITLFLNGELIGSESNNLELSSIDQALNFGREGSLNRYFKGSLDDIAIWNRALTPEEVHELYTLDACTFTIYDTLTVENVINVYDTLTIENIVDIFDTTYINVEVYDTLTVENIVNVYDTLTIENVVSVYDTLFTNVENIINVYDTTYTNIENVIDVYDTTTVVETVFEYDTLTIENIVEVYDTLTVENVIDIYDTTTVVETVLIYDTLTVENVIDVYDTTYVTVTDTLIIDIPSGVEGTILNTLLLYPNPTSDQLTINYGNFAAMAGYSLSIFNNGGSAVYEDTDITQAQETLDISQWSAGVYQVVVYNTGGVPVETRQIVIQ